MIAIATGTRADWGLLSPLALELKRRGEDIEILATNMHLDPRFGNTVEEIVTDGFEPVRIPASGSPAEITASVIRGFSSWFEENRPDKVVILGDRFEMLGVATAALLSGVEVVHIAGGTVSEGAFDNSIRNAISQIASLHLTETELCGERLMAMGIPEERIVVAGTLGVFNFNHGERMDREALERSLQFRFEDPTLLVTLHPATLSRMSPLTQMSEMLVALADIMHPDEETLKSIPDLDRLKIIFTYPNNDRDSEGMIRLLEKFCSDHPDRTLLVKSLGRVRYQSALRYCAAVVGNSSSGIVEVPSAGIPTLDIGIRQKGRECADSVIHCGADAASIMTGLRKVLSPEIRRSARTVMNPYSRPDTPKIMADAIRPV